MSARAAVALIVCAILVALIGAGCTSFSMRASEARMPILVGPVPCIGCAPARAVASSTVTGSDRDNEVGFPLLCTYADSVTHETAPLDLAATKAVPDPCREDLHVSSIQTGSWGFVVPLLFDLGKTWVDVQASRAAVPNGTCGDTPMPSAGPTGIMSVASDKARDGRKR